MEKSYFLVTVVTYCGLGPMRSWYARSSAMRALLVAPWDLVGCVPGHTQSLHSLFYYLGHT